MKHHLKNILSAVLYAATVLQLLSLMSCAREDLSWLLDTPVNVTASAKQPTTRSGADIQTSNFDEGATLNAYFSITGSNPVEYIGKKPTVLTASAAENGKNRLTPDVQPYYPSDHTIDIMALYPTDVTNATTAFTVKANQEAEADYKASDLMWAGKTAQAKTSADVNLQFQHQMSKMSVTVTAKEGVLVEEVSLTNVVRTINITSLSAAGCTLGDLAPVNDADEKTIVVASTEATAPNNSLSGSALFPPQTIGGNFIKVKTNYGTALYSAGGMEFKRGEAYTANIVVKRQDIGFTTAITDWELADGSLAIPPGSSAGLRIAAIDTIDYDGTAQEPPLTIDYYPNDTESSTGLAAEPYHLVAGEDYTAEYFNNVRQGTAMVIITGKASESRPEVLANIIKGIKAMTSFVIRAAEGNISYSADEKHVYYQYNTTIDGFDLATNGGDGQFTYLSTDENVATVNRSGRVTIKNVGTTTIKAYMDNTGNYTADSAKYTLKVLPRRISEAVAAGKMTVELVGTSFPYNGTEYRPAAIVRDDVVDDNGRLLQEGKHYTYSVANNTASGTATVTIRGKGNYNDTTTYSVQRTFSIVQQQAKITMSTDAAIVAKGTGFTYQRRATTTFGMVKYRSSNTSYATVDENGVVTGVAPTPANSPVTITAYVEADNTANHGWTAATDVSYQVTVTETDWEFKYTNDTYAAAEQIQTWTCPKDGFYKLEAMGAQGATVGSFSGGRGADIAGQVFIRKGQVLYIYLGQGGSVQSGSGNTYTFNGGGYYAGSTGNDDASNFGAGGGATDFALMHGTWDSDAHLYSRILVAGGGGGALYYSTPVYCGPGGAGGAYVGQDGIGGTMIGHGGTLSGGGAVTATDENTNTGSGGNAGSFGKGGHFSGTTSAGCGGGGWFGGASGQAGGRQGAGGGGSSFIYNATNITAAGNISGSSKYDALLKLPTATEGTVNLAANNFFVKTAAEATGTKTWLEITPVTLIEGGSASENGLARITYMGDEE